MGHMWLSFSPQALWKTRVFCYLQLINIVRKWLHKKLVQEFKVVIKWIIKIKASSFRYVHWIYEEDNNEKVKTLVVSRNSCVQTFAGKQIQEQVVKELFCCSDKAWMKADSLEISRYLKGIPCYFCSGSSSFNSLIQSALLWRLLNMKHIHLKHKKTFPGVLVLPDLKIHLAMDAPSGCLSQPPTPCLEKGL